MKLSRRSFFLGGIAAVAVTPIAKANPYDKWWEDELVPREFDPKEYPRYVQIFRKTMVIRKVSATKWIIDGTIE